MAASEIDTVLRQAADSPETVLETLKLKPELASQSDAFGYTLVQAAASYNHLTLLRYLVKDLGQDINATDEDDETALFLAETPETARCIIEELGGDPKHVNVEGVNVYQNAQQQFLDEGGSWERVVAYYKEILPQEMLVGLKNAEGEEVPPRLPDGLTITGVEEMDTNEELQPNEELQRRISELAARVDLQSDAGQEELRRLVREALGGYADEVRDRRQRMD